ncbi:TPA: replication protein [Enterobacter ludwigii]|nr:replication protein [Enterobacter ludwigii]HDR2600146.1 replication protein [Enterobacter ludwigii]
MLVIYSSRWETKNGSVPSDLWIAQIGSLTSDQTTSVCNAMVARCRAGNSWPPDLAEFVTLVADCGGNALGLRTADVMAEYTRWRNESYRYSNSTEFPWRHDVLYQICTEMRRTGTERQMTERELEQLAATQLAKWEKHVADGGRIPPVRKQLEAPRHPSGQTPAQMLQEEYRRRKAAGLI